MMAPQSPWTLGNALRWIGGISVVVIALIRCVITILPQAFFDVDPTFVIETIRDRQVTIDDLMAPGLPPAGSLLLDVLLLVACACGLFGEALTKRSIDWRLLAAALVGAPFVLWHGAHEAGDVGDLWRGSTWAAAIIACVVLAHLARDRLLRHVLLAVLLLALAPVTVQAMMQSRVEIFGVAFEGPDYRQKIDIFEASGDDFLESKGWSVDSAEARIYERRLRQPSPRGWFPSTNIFASLMAFAVVVAGGAAIGQVRCRRNSAVAGAWLGAVGIAAVMLWLTGSKGAMLAAVAGFVVLCAPLVHSSVRSIVARYAGWLFIAMVAAALLGVVLRGVILPEGFIGEKSLLFRWHYMVAAIRVIGENLLTGVGPDGFKEAYVAVRVPRNPEEVASAHSVFLDWVAMLGVLTGLAWTGLCLTLLRKAPTPADASSGDAASSGSVLRHWLASASIDWPLAVGVAVLMVHAQIEMTLFDPGSVVWVMCALGLAASGAPRVGGSKLGFIGAVIVMALALWIMFSAVIPTRRAEHMVGEAALAFVPASPEQLAQQREQAAGLLLAAYEHHLPTDVKLINEASRQLAAATLERGAQRERLFARSIELIEQAIEDHDHLSSIVIAAQLYQLRAARTGDAHDWDRAIASARRMTERDPHAVASWRRLGEYLAGAGRPDEAITAYRQALRNSDNFELDELKQLSPAARQLIEERIEELESQ